MSRTTSIRSRVISARCRNQRGFVMFEVFVAFVILAIGLGVISTGVVVAMRADSRTQTRRIALRLAQSRLEAAGISEALAPGYREGRIGKNFTWQETVTAVRPESKPLELSDAKPNKPDESTAVASYWVEVELRAADGTVAKLAGLKLASEAKR